MKRPISLWIIIFLLSLIMSYHIYYSFLNYANEITVREEIEEMGDEPKEESIPVIKEEEPLGVLEIPKIKVKQVFYSLDSPQNNVNRHVTLLEGSMMPNVYSTYLLLAAHSGNSYLGYFHYLSSLIIGDEVNIYYEKQKYTYLIDDIYYLPKNGQISFHKNKDENLLVLTTCGKDNNQLVVVAKIFKKK